MKFYKNIAVGTLGRDYLFAISILCGTLLFAQEKKFEGQPPITIIPTTSLPVQKQWKGDFEFLDSDIVFSNDFDGARLNGIVKDNDSTYTALITPENTPINSSPWYAFQVWSQTPRTIYLNLTYPEGVKHRYYPKLSSDGRNWVAIDSVDYTEFEKGTDLFGPGSLPVRVQLKLKVSSEKSWIAGQELQNSTHVQEWVSQLAKKSFVSKSVIGKSTEGRNINLLSIGNQECKNVVMVISRQHPPEVTGYLAMKAFVEALSSNSKLAKKFRKKFVVYVVPLMNPDGVDNGYWRHNQGGIDLNRDWSNFNQPETAAVRDFISKKLRITKGKLYFSIDFHSTWDDIYYTVDPKLKGNMPGLVPDWLNGVAEEIPDYEPNVKPNDQLIPTAVSRNYFFVEHGSEALVFEVGDNTPRKFLIEKASISATVLMELMLKKQ